MVEKNLIVKLHVCLPPSPHQQVALFNLRYENGYDVFVDPDYVSWLLETHPEDVPADIMTGVSDPWLLETHPEDIPTDIMTGVGVPFQPLTTTLLQNDISDFIMDSSDLDFPEWYEENLVTLLGDPDNKDNTSLFDFVERFVHYQRLHSLLYPINQRNPHFENDHSKISHYICLWCID